MPREKRYRDNCNDQHPKCVSIEALHLLTLVCLFTGEVRRARNGCESNVLSTVNAIFSKTLYSDIKSDVKLADSMSFASYPCRPIM